MDELREIKNKVKFIRNYMSPNNPADSSDFDPNANVTSKNIVTMQSEMVKKDIVFTNRALLYEKIEEMYGKSLADEYIKQLNEHIIYKNDESGLMAYTYGSSESVVAYKDDKKILVSFEDLYEMYDDEEVLDSNVGVYAKYPKDLYIEDINGKTKVTRLIRKNRHRDMVRVKLKCGEDLLVTDNHPLIIDKSNIDKTVDAIDSLGYVQFKKDIAFEDSKYRIEVLDEFDYEDYGSYCIRKNQDQKKNEGIKKTIKLSDKLGYFIGVFIAEGNIGEHTVSITQNDDSVLKKIASYLYDETGITGKIYLNSCPSHDGRNPKYTLTYSSTFLKDLLELYFGIKKYSHRICLPKNILETNREFIGGLICGIIDGDGTVTDTRANIRVASRKLISQLSILLRCFGFGVNNSYQEQKEQAFGSYSSNYPVFGINFGLTGSLDLSMSFKINNNIKKITKKTRYKESESEISDVRVIKNKKYLQDDIYDITTESRHFLCNNIMVHNCVSISMYPFILNGLNSMGGEGIAPKHLESFVGGVINLTYMVASQVCGAVALPEILLYMDYFAKKDLGRDYIEYDDNKRKIKKYFEQIVYSLNQPAGTRTFQSIFWNVSMFDEHFFNSMFGNFIFPDGSKPEYDSLFNLQKLFMDWFQKERERSILTFPVITMAMVVENEENKDKKFEDFVADCAMNGDDFFIYQGEATSLSSCCFDGDVLVPICKSEIEVEYIPFNKLKPNLEYSVLYSKKDDLNEEDDSIYERKIKKAKLVKTKPKNNKMIKFTFVMDKYGKEELLCTEDHIFPTSNGDKMAKDINIEEDSFIFANNSIFLDNFCIKKETIKNYNKDVYCMEILNDENKYFNVNFTNMMLGNDIITHNCRLKNDIDDNTFSHSLGAGGVATGSLSVMTLNLPRFIHKCDKSKRNIEIALINQLEKMHKWQNAYKHIIKEYIDNKMIPIYDAGYIQIDKQFLTIGINGVPEAYELSKNKLSGNNDEYKNWVKNIFEIITRENTRAREVFGHRFNTELIPAENVAVKFAKWDREDGINDKYDIYSSYYYKPDDDSVNISDKFILHAELGKFCDGGQALHLNLDEHYKTKEQFKEHLKIASKLGLFYWTWNVPRTYCEKCGTITKKNVKSCPKCNSRKLKYATRIIGYLKFVDNFSEGRRNEENKRIYHKNK